MEEFSCMIFNYLHQKWRKQTEEAPSNGLQINTINHEISNIVSHRQLNRNDTETDSHGDEPEPPNPLPIQTNINDLTDVLVQEIASYLPFKSYSNFQSCCRSIFYAANTPSALYELDDNIKIDGCINTANVYQRKAFMKRFERVQKLAVPYSRSSFDPNDNEEYIQLISFMNLKYLRLYFPVDIEPYVSKNMFKWNEIRTLDFAGDTDNACEIIKRCTNLSTLVLNEINDDENKLANLNCLSNLQCLVLLQDMNVDTRIMLKNICNTLQSLTVTPSQHNLDGLPFPQLVELCLIDPEPNDLSSIIKRTKHLKRLRLSIFAIDHLYRDLKKFSFRSVFELDTLEYFYIDCALSEASFLSSVRSIETSFHQKRDTLKLKLTFRIAKKWKNSTLTPDKVHVAILRTFNTLCTWCTGDLMLLVEMHSGEYKELKALNEWLNNISNAYFVHVDKALINKRQRVIIANKGNAFNGYEERLIAPYCELLDDV
eukprot:489209_1